jgi:hypothetical protein
MNFSTDTWILIALNASGVFAAYYFPIRKIQKEKNNEKSDSFVYLKKKTIFWIVSVLSIVLVGDLGWYLHKSKEPLLVFAGGGSVRNFLLESPEYKNEKNGEGIDVRKGRNSINIAMASESAWRVLAEEYHNEKICKKDHNLKRFITICLSAGKMSPEFEFYKEYIKPLEDDVIVPEVYLGEDPLIVYISDNISKEWKKEHIDTIHLKTLASKLQMVIEGKDDFAVFTTNKMSGTLEKYKMSFQELFHQQNSKMLQDSIAILQLDSIKDSKQIERIQNSIEKRSFVDLEKMLNAQQAYIYYDKTNPDCIYSCYGKRDDKPPFIILGSSYYYVENVKNPDGQNLKEIYVLDDKGNKICKPMYLYFLANKVADNDNSYKVEERVIKFLKMIENNIDFKTDDWNNMMENGTINHHLNNESTEKIKEMNPPPKKQ